VFSSKSLPIFATLCTLSCGALAQTNIYPPQYFPYPITQSGSYRLTGNLILPAGNPNNNAIEVSAPNVTIDLNGYTIQGTGNCTQSGTSVSCVTSSNAGISSLATSGVLVVRNGIVRGFGTGISIPGTGIVESVRVSNSKTGIRIGTNQIPLGQVSPNRVSDTSVELTEMGIDLGGGFIERVTVSRSGLGINGNGTDRTAVLNSFIVQNTTGMTWAAVRGSRVIGNVSNFGVGAVSY
jgi:hypothetical protein